MFGKTVVAGAAVMAVVNAENYELNWVMPTSGSYDDMTLCEGDVLTFTWSESPTTHDAVVSDDGTCPSSYGTGEETGTLEVAITADTDATYVCTVGGHCGAGQKIKVTGGAADCTRAGTAQATCTDDTGATCADEEETDENSDSGAAGASVVAATAIAAVAAIVA